MRLSRKLLGGAAVVVATVVLSATVYVFTRVDATAERARSAGRTSTAAPTAAVRSAPRVLVLGDSNLAFADASVQAAFEAAGIGADLHGVPGFGLKNLHSFWLHILPAIIAANPPDVVVVALGTNDSWLAHDTQAFPTRLDELMSALGHRRVVWVTHFDERFPPVGDRKMAIADDIRAAPSRWPNLSVLDLIPLIRQYRAQLLSPDELHFSPAGQRVFGAELVDAAEQAVRGPRPRTAITVPSALPVPVPLSPVTVPGQL